MYVAARLSAVVGSALINAAIAFAWQRVPPPPPKQQPTCIDCFGTYTMVADTGLFIESRVRLGTRDPAPLPETRVQPCRRGLAVGRDPVLLTLVPRPLVPGRYRTELAFCVEVGRDGRATQAFVLHSSGDRDTDARALRRLRALRFEPAMRDGQPVASWHRMTTGEPWISTLLMI
jgi:TonB family protein